jgi:hypothetical protein
MAKEILPGPEEASKKLLELEEFLNEHDMSIQHDRGGRMIFVYKGAEFAIMGTDTGEEATELPNTWETCKLIRYNEFLGRE